MQELAHATHLSESACLRRVRALEQAGVIDRYAAVVSQNKVGLPGNVFVSITLNRQDQTDLAAFKSTFNTWMRVESQWDFRSR